MRGDDVRTISSLLTTSAPTLSSFITRTYRQQLYYDEGTESRRVSADVRTDRRENLEPRGTVQGQQGRRTTSATLSSHCA